MCCQSCSSTQPMKRVDSRARRDRPHGRSPDGATQPARRELLRLELLEQMSEDVEIAGDRGGAMECSFDAALLRPCKPDLDRQRELQKNLIATRQKYDARHDDRRRQRDMRPTAPREVPAAAALLPSSPARRRARPPRRRCPQWKGSRADREVGANSATASCRAAISAGAAGAFNQAASFVSPARVRAIDRSSKSEPRPNRSRSFA